MPAEMRNAKLGQVRPSTTSATLIFTPPEITGNQAVQWEGHSVVVCNRGAITAKASIYHDDAQNSSYDDDSVLVDEDPIEPNETKVYALGMKGSSKNDHVAVKSSVADAINFTFYGKREFK